MCKYKLTTSFDKKLIIAETKSFSEKAISYLPVNVQVTKKELNNDDLLWAFKEFDYFWFRLGFRISEELLRLQGRRVSVIICPVTGLDHIDIQTCNELDVKIISLRGENDFLKEVRATAELTLGLTLALLRNIPDAVYSVKQRIWDRNKFKGTEILNKQVGIIGMGRLGSIMANYFLAFGAKVFAYDIKEFTVPKVTQVKNIKELVRNCDIISLHINYNNDNHHIINSNLLKEFKKGSIFINTSRGSLVDSGALINELKNGNISGAALDVIEDEFNILNNPLIEYAKANNNCIITPHIGGNTAESFEKTEIFVAEKFSKYFQNNE